MPAILTASGPAINHPDGGTVTYAPDCLEEVREACHVLTGAALRDIGIVGGPDHDDGYHLGLDTLLLHQGWEDWSAQLTRDKSALRGPTANAACAIDFPVAGMRDHRAWFRQLLEDCRDGAAHTAGIRAIIGTLDGVTAYRYDRLDGWTARRAHISHTWHTHVEWFRDIIANSPDLTGIITVFYGGVDMDGNTPFVKADDVAVPGLPKGFSRPFKWWVSAIYAHVIGTEGHVIKGNAADAIRDTALEAAVKRLGDVIESGGGNVDTAAILAGVKAEVNRVLPSVEAKVDEELERMAAAFAAAAGEE